MTKKSSRLIKSKVLYPISRKDAGFFFKHKRFLFLTLGVIGMGFLAVVSALKIGEKAPLWMKNVSVKMGFVLEDLMVEGRQNTSREELLKILQMKRGDPLFSFSPAVLKKNLEELPWVRSAIVERRLPHTFHIHLAERKALALWQRKGSFHLLDGEGKIIPCSSPEFPQGLLVVVGEDAPEHAKALLTALEKTPAMRRRVTAAVHLRSGRWDLHLDNKWILKLPETALAEALQHFLSFEHKYPFLNPQVVAVDLRLPGVFIIRLTPGAAQKGRARKLKTSAVRKDA